MTYHDNDVYLSLGGGYSLISGSYSLTGYSVTNGQDPKGYIHNGLVVNCGSNGKLTFKVGRKGSGEVASWFNTRVPANRNTFNHTAGDLNFAFMGTLTITVTGGILGGGRDTYTFQNVSLAQGHSGASNNWWFGGSTCMYISNNEVSCTGTNAKGAPVLFMFRRGGAGNDVNNVAVTPKILVDTANWMKPISNATRLDQIMMPGSHDAGMSELHHCAPPVVGDGYTQTQSGSIGQQLQDGSRYFDIRVDYDYNKLVTYHRTDGWGCNGQDLQQVLDQARSFLTAHPSETAIFKFSHIRSYEDHKPADTKRRINELLNSYQAIMYSNASGSVNLAEIKLSDARGKMILVFDYDDYINTSTGRFRYKDGGSIQPGANITVFDEYSNTTDYEKMKKDQLQKWAAYGGLGTGRFFLLSWTLTPSPPGKTVAELAKIANDHLPGVLYDQIVSKHTSKPNIVYIDYVASNVCQSIILYNY